MAVGDVDLMNGRTEGIDRIPDFADVEIVELDEAADVGRRLW